MPQMDASWMVAIEYLYYAVAIHTTILNYIVLQLLRIWSPRIASATRDVENAGKKHNTTKYKSITVHCHSMQMLAWSMPLRMPCERKRLEELMGDLLFIRLITLIISFPITVQARYTGAHALRINADLVAQSACGRSIVCFPVRGTPWKIMSDSLCLLL